jgi:bifunctional aspartokinase / homoserine dehydrogenase 1
MSNISNISKKKIVAKFGGSNLKRKEDIENIIRVIRLYNRPVVIVVSALYGVTNSLIHALREVKSNENAVDGIKNNLLNSHREIIDMYIENGILRDDTMNKINLRLDELEKFLRGIHYLGEIPEFVEDKVLSCGERLSSLVFSAVLNDRNIPCTEYLPENLGLFTNGESRNASVDFSLSEKQVKHLLSGDKIYVIPGFYGISADSRITLLGRGGSDYTAAAIARCIDASSVDLWKDVYGFMTADPKLVKNASIIERLTYNEAAELSYFGAKILHPRTFEPAVEKKIPIRLFNIHDFTDSLEPVTVICDKGIKKADVIKSVTSSDDFGILRLHGAGVGIKPGIMANITGKLNEGGINIKSVITAQTSINILLSREDLEKGLKIAQGIGLSTVDRIDALDDISLIAVVGDGILEKPGIAARIFSAVSLHHINIRMISAGASNEAIYFIIDKKESHQAISSIHDEFFGEKNAFGDLPFLKEGDCVPA